MNKTFNSSLRLRLACGGFLVPLTLAGCGGSSSSSSTASTPIADAPAVISQSNPTFSGSDYTLSLLPSGAATYNLVSVTPPPAAATFVLGPTQTNTVPAALTAQFFKDLAAAMPLQNLPAFSGASSVGPTTVTLQYQGQKGYLNDPNDAREQALEADVQAIAKALGLPLG